MNKLVRAMVFGRAQGRCEGCLGYVTAETGHLDHFFGRAKAEETPENCWALCPHCDHEKTNNRPSAMHWLRKFAQLCATNYGAGRDEYKAPLERAFTKMAVQHAKGMTGGPVR